MKNTLTLLMTAAILIILSACQENAVTNELRLSDVYPLPFHSIKKVEIVDGRNGNKVVLTNKDEIALFVAELEKMKLEEYQSSEKREGYLWLVRLKSKDTDYQMTSYQFADRHFMSEPAFNDVVFEFITNQ